ncbi:putative transposase, Ptta/En/Spm, plant [Sesbania bispinosa]|nr:putative transposase, Ptta/En/Spm, plant [Sesbania bispinosa]
MKTQDKGERSTSNFELPQVRSSMELRRQFTIKREHITRNLGETIAPKGKGSGQNQVPRNQLITQSKKSLQIQGPNRQPMIKAVVQDDVTKAKLQAMQKEMTQYEVTSARQEPKKQTAGENGSARPSQQTMKKTIVETEGLRADQRPKKRTMVENDSLRENQFLIKRAVAENDRVRPKQQPMKKAVAENDCVRPKQQPMKKVVAENKSLRANQQLKKGLVVENDNLRETRQPIKRVMVESDNSRAAQQPVERVVAENGTSKKRTRGPIKCLKIHSRPTKDREEVILDNDGEPIGPNDKVVSEFSYFLGTIARNSDFCPLIYTNFKALLENHKEDIWEYVNDKYIIPGKGEKAVFSRINDAWRSYKSKVKKRHYKRYSTLTERLKNRPGTIPETHFKQLMAYWGNSTIQNISKKNAMNRAKQKYVHRTGPINFARIRAKLREKKNDGEEVTQAEMFIETHKSRKGKEVDEQTQFAIEKLEDSINDSSESAKQAFQSLFGKEKSGKVRCYGRTITPSQLKRNEEFDALKKQHSNELNSWISRTQGMEALLRCFLKQNNPTLDDEAIDIMMADAIANENSAALPCSSTSTYTPNVEKVTEDEDHFEDVQEESCS